MKSFSLFFRIFVAQRVFNAAKVEENVWSDDFYAFGHACMVRLGGV